MGAVGAFVTGAKNIVGAVGAGCTVPIARWAWRRGKMVIFACVFQRFGRATKIARLDAINCPRRSTSGIFLLVGPGRTSRTH